MGLFNCVHHAMLWRDERYKSKPILITFDEGNKYEDEVIGAATKYLLNRDDHLVKDFIPEMTGACHNFRQQTYWLLKLELRFRQKSV